MDATSSFGAFQSDTAAPTRRHLAADEALTKLPPPFHARWFPDEFSSRAVQVALCYSYEVFLGTTPSVRAVQGFNFSNDPDSKKPKPGLIAWQAGGWVRE